MKPSVYHESIRTNKRSCFKRCIGCGYACLHCKTGTVGLKRNLTSEEMVIQAQTGLSYGKKGSRPEVIYFGSGEPFLNFENVIKSMHEIHERIEGIDNYNQLQVSTSGVPGKIIQFAQLNINPTLAISIHTANQEKRAYLIPQSVNYGLDKLYREVMYYQDKVGQQIIIHYTLIKGFNTDDESIEALHHYIKDFNCKVFVIPFNEYSRSLFQEPDQNEALNFINRLTELGHNAELRPSRGRDIAAACGQLVCKLEMKERGSNQSF